MIETKVIISHNKTVTTLDVEVFQFIVGVLKDVGYQNLYDELMENTVVQKHPPEIITKNDNAK